MDETSYQALTAYNRETKRLDDVYRGAVKKSGLPACAFWILYTLRMESGSFTQSQICEFLYEPKQTVNSALKKLEADGYLSLSPGADQRSKPVQLTDKGLQLASVSADRVADAEAQALLSMTREERERFIQLTVRYRTLLEDALQKDGAPSESKI